MKPFFLIAVAMSFMVLPVSVFAHGTDYRLIGNNEVVAAEFFYSDKVPMQYAEVLVFSPENDTVEYQNGRTDQNGRFAFLAEQPGDWQVKVNDGMGHAVHATVTVNPVEAKLNTIAQPNDHQLNTVTEKKDTLFANVSMSIKLFFGLSILLNFFLGMYIWKRNR